MALWFARARAAAVTAVCAASLGLALPGVAAAAAASGAAGSAATAGSATGSVQEPAVPAGMVTVANDGTLRMDMDINPNDKKTIGDFEIVDLRNGAVFQSSFPTPQSLAQNPVQQANLKAQFYMTETTVQRLPPGMQYEDQFNFSQDYASLTVDRIANGVAMHYMFNNGQPGGIEWTADLTLSGDHMTVTIPYKQIYEPQYNPPSGQVAKEDPIGQNSCPRFPKPPPKLTLQLFYFPPDCNLLASISFLDAFGAGRPGQDGYLVVPDGSGAEVAFSAQHPIFTTEFDQPVYGDETVTPYQDRWLPEANMPVYGIVHTSASNPSQSEAMLAIATKGVGNAEVVAVPAGQRANVYKAYFKFTYRPEFNALGVGLAQQLQFSWHPVAGDRQAVYYFLPGSQANYAGLALRYRTYLMQKQNVQPLKPQTQPPLLLRVLNGIREQGVPFAPFEKATTFAQTQQMVASLQSSGVGAIRLTLEGWMRNGMEWTDLPSIWPPDGRLGGTGGLRKLAAYDSAHNVQTVVAVDMYHAFQNSNGYNIRQDSLHQESKLFLLDFGTYMVSPDVAQNLLYPRLQKELQRAGITGTDFNYLARDVYPNYQTKHTLTRSQSAADWSGMMSSAAKTLGTAGVQGGNTYAVGSAGYFYNAPLTDSGYAYETRSIPFWEIAVHGLALYSGREWNLLDAPQMQKLQAIEDGALPVWELTWQPASVLRYTMYNLLYSSQFSQWGPKAVAEYQQEQQRGYSQLAYVAITGNESVQPGVHVTDYQNGKHVIVNYNNFSVTLPQYGNVTVPAQDYVVVSGGGGH